MADLLSYFTTPSGFVLVPLAICSVLALALILDRVIALAQMRAPGPEADAGIRKLSSTAGTSAALEQLIGMVPFYAPAAEALAASLHRQKPLRDEAASLALQAAGRTYSRRLTGLMTLASLAPLLGLMGTVIGLMVAFHNIEGTTGPVEPGTLAGGLWQAMITTAVGLGIAVPCLISHAWLKSRIRNRITDAAALLSALSLAAELDRTEAP
mgnify:CR=1 FL=1